MVIYLCHDFYVLLRLIYMKWVAMPLARCWMLNYLVDMKQFLHFTVVRIDWSRICIMHVSYLMPLPDMFRLWLLLGATLLPRNPERCCGLLQVHFLIPALHTDRTMLAGNENPERQEIKDNLLETVWQGRILGSRVDVILKLLYYWVIIQLCDWGIMLEKHV